MSRWGSAFRLIATAVAVTFLPGSWAANWQLFAAQAESERQRRKRDKGNNRARAAFNDALKDRLQMVDLTPDMPRSLCLGRVRYVEGVRRRWTSGTNSEKLTMLVSFAGHEIDAFEGWYIDDTPVTLDGSGYVQEAPWRTTANTPAQNTGTLDGSGGLVIVLSHTPVSGTVTATWATGGSGDSNESGTCTVSMSGATATLSGGRAGAPVNINYERSVATNYVRIRTYLGTDAQNVGDALDAEYPGKITATDRLAGIALGVVDLTFSPDVFTQGPPNVTAVFRGAKCYDPRLDSTLSGGSGSHRIANPSTWAWTENPALHFLRYALWSGGLRLTAAQVTARTLADVAAAATRCDISTGFTLTKPDTSTSTVTLPRHRGAFTISSDADKRQVLDTICDAMAGEWAWDGPNLRVRAGMMASSVAAIDQTWLVQGVAAGGEDDSEPVITASQAIGREQRVNRITGKCIDPDQRHQLLPYPAVSDTVLIAAKGEKREEVDFPGVNHIAHAQHLASIEIRRRQAGTLMQLQCDARAELLELFDVVTLTVPDYGITAKTMEVVGTDMPMVPNDAVVGLMAREITSAIYDVTGTLAGRDPAPDSSLRAPWDVGTLGTLTVTSGTAALLDNSIVARAQVTWAAVTGEWIRNGGEIELQYTRADQALPAGDWASWVEPGTATAAIIPGLMAGRPYLFRGRLVQRMPLVRGAWSAVALHTMSATLGNLGALGGGNMLRNSDMEVDSDATGLPDSWTAFSAGTTGSVTYAVVTGGIGAGQRVRTSVTGLGTDTGDRAGFYQIVELANLGGRPFAFSAFATSNTSSGVVDLVLFCDFRAFSGGGGSSVGAFAETAADAANAWTRYVLRGFVPAAAQSVIVFIWAAARNTATGAAEFSADKAQFELGNPTAYAPRADELLTGVVTAGNIAAGSVTVTVFDDAVAGSHFSGISPAVHPICAAAYENTTGEAVVVRVDVVVIGLFSDPSGGSSIKNEAGWRYRIDGGSWSTVKRIVLDGGVSRDYEQATNGFTFSEVSLSAGEEIEAEAWVFVAGVNENVNWEAGSLRLSVFRR